ncbi:MAG TPA: hypothetical protein VI078_02840 [bacterium]
MGIRAIATGVLLALLTVFLAPAGPTAPPANSSQDTNRLFGTLEEGDADDTSVADIFDTPLLLADRPAVPPAPELQPPGPDGGAAPRDGYASRLDRPPEYRS